jgi:hypothetical protein
MAILLLGAMVILVLGLLAGVGMAALASSRSAPAQAAAKSPDPAPAAEPPGPAPQPPPAAAPPPAAPAPQPAPDPAPPAPKPPPPPAAPPPAPPAATDDEKAVHRAIDRGVAYLKQVLKLRGDEELTSANPDDGSELRQQTIYNKALVGWTSLECGVPATDPYIKEISAFVRVEPSKVCDTADLAMAILFLDRLGDPDDRPIVRTYALRLVAGQKQQGMWGAKCLLSGGKLPDVAARNPLLAAGLKEGLEQRPIPEEDQTKFAEYLRANADVTPDAQPAERPSGVEKLPDYLQSCGVVRWQRGLEVPPVKWETPAPPVPGRAPGTTLPGRPILDDNIGDDSDTVLAMTALWVARRDGAPVLPSLAFAERYYRRMQRPDGGWRSLEFLDPYISDRSVYADSDARSTGGGLLGLAIGDAVAAQVAKDRGKAAPAANAALAKGLGLLDDMMKTKIRRDNINEWGTATDCWGLDGAVNALGVKLIGGVEWRPWATKHLVQTQDDDGSWNQRQVGGFQATYATCYALLLLKGVNPFSDVPGGVATLRPVQR